MYRMLGFDGAAATAQRGGSKRVKPASGAAAAHRKAFMVVVIWSVRRLSKGIG
jgi:hypothetical protein